jgi:acyl carrier protein
MSDADSLAAFLESFIRERFLVSDRDQAFRRDVHLWESGYVDSIGVVELIARIEEMFRIKIPEEILFDQDFNNINGMARLIAGLLKPSEK